MQKNSWLATLHQNVLGCPDKPKNKPLSVWKLDWLLAFKMVLQKPRQSAPLCCPWLVSVQNGYITSSREEIMMRKAHFPLGVGGSTIRAKIRGHLLALWNSEGEVFSDRMPVPPAPWDDGASLWDSGRTSTWQCLSIKLLPSDFQIKGQSQELHDPAEPR